MKRHYHVVYLHPSLTCGCSPACSNRSFANLEECLEIMLMKINRVLNIYSGLATPVYISCAFFRSGLDTKTERWPLSVAAC